MRRRSRAATSSQGFAGGRADCCWPTTACRRPQRRDRRGRLHARALPVQRASDDDPQQVGIDGLGQELPRTALNRLQRQPVVGMPALTGQHDRRRAPSARSRCVPACEPPEAMHRSSQDRARKRPCSSSVNLCDPIGSLVQRRNRRETADGLLPHHVRLHRRKPCRHRVRAAQGSDARRRPVMSGLCR